MDLPIEVLNRIFKQVMLKKDLFSCSLVNRTWSLVALPILWNKPVYSEALIQTLISCFSQQDKDNLVQTGIRLDSWINIGSGIDYPSYIFDLYYSSLLIYVNRFLSKQNNQQKKRLTYYLMQYLCKLLMNRCINLKNLEFRNLNLTEYFIIPFYHFPGADGNLINITSMTLDFSLSFCDQFFYALSGICKQIKSLSLWDLNENNALMYFIESQAFLKNLSIWCSDVQFPTNGSSENLEKRANFLKSLVLYESSVSASFLAQCINLNVLKVTGDKFFRMIENVMDFNRLKLNNLEKILFDDVSNEYMDKITKLLDRTNVLKEITLMIDSDHSIELTKVIVHNYTNLVDYKGLYDDSQIILLHIFVQNCPFLEKLVICDNKTNNSKFNFNDELMRLGNVIPRNLKKLRLKKSWIYNAFTLNSFMKKCFEKLKGSFEFYININDHDYSIQNYDKQIMFKGYDDGLIHVECYVNR
ncbi:8292_t:CDS:1 [Funneliformis geosporum]|uniref:17590_t:CDS:1 n=1 Tax=Funneliformis geosporum TaxID=1117311 RepID=A0A9W4WR61_9GLOM|nr:8292_t:CDS:1 [Funneliformis geosporum]CAI2165961.1 17590_t:CDS:1 [Funneliformis geosporum]